ncbi:MAG: hypothetical protein EPN91_02505 [Salinibacterium sp.]|nr:MAG: hypothetical protein EPN91_02505 [Salinibacterium sp.]
MPVHAEAPAESIHFPAPDFDVREFARTAVGSHRGNLNLQSYASQPLTAQTLRALAYLHNVESATMSHLRGVLVTATHKDARITAFLATWAFEKYWIADALAQIIQWHVDNGADAPAAALTNAPAERTVRESIVANFIGVPMIGVHMALCTVDEWLTQAAYERIAALDANPQLAETLAALRSVKARQLTFFEAQARFRLTESKRSRTMTASRLRKTSWPIGSRAEPTEETAFFFSYLFATAPELVAKLDARVDDLPGQQGLGLIRKASTT